MAEISVNGNRIEVDVEEEIRKYDWDNARWSGHKLIASSPFRPDRAPSFFVNFDTGGWADSGAIGEYESGNLIDLLAYLRGSNSQEVSEYLISEYGAGQIIETEDDIRIKSVTLEQRP